MLFKYLKNNSIQRIALFATISTILMLMTNMLAFRKFYFGEYSSPLIVFAVYSGTLIILFFLYLKYYTMRQIQNWLFYSLKYFLIPFFLEFSLSAIMAQEEHRKITSIVSKNKAHVAAETNSVKLKSAIAHYNELIKSAKNIDQVNLECRRAKPDVRNRESERVWAWASELESATVENAASLSEVIVPKNLGCAKSGTIHKVKKINDLRLIVLQLADKQSKLEGEEKILEINKELNIDTLDAINFISENKITFALIFIANGLLYYIFLAQSLNRLMLISAESDPFLPRNEILGKLVSYEFSYHNENNKNRKWIFWRWFSSRRFFSRRHQMYKRYRIVKFNCQNEDDVKKINHLHSKSCPISATLITELQCKSLYDINILDDDIYDSDYRFYCFPARDFDRYFAYQVCM